MERVGVCVSLGESQGRSRLDSKCQNQVDVHPTAVPSEASLLLCTQRVSPPKPQKYIKLGMCRGPEVKGGPWA